MSFPAASVLTSATIRLSRQAAFLSIVATIYFLCASVAVHVVSPQYDVFRDYISDYAIGPYGWIFGSAFWASFIATAALAAALVGTVPETALSRVGLVLLLVSAVASPILYFFPTDILPPGAPPTTMTGAIHSIAAMIGWIAFAVSAIALTLRFRRDAYWRAGYGPLLGLAVLSILLFAALFVVVVSKAPFGGLAEKLFIVDKNIWALIAGFMALTADDPKESP